MIYKYILNNNSNIIKRKMIIKSKLRLRKHDAN